ALLSAAGATRGEEERGLVEQWLGAGTGRARLLAVRFGTFAVTAAVAVAATCIAGLVGGAGGGTPLEIGGLAGQGLALWAVMLACYGVTLLVVQQFAAYRSGTAAAGGV